MREPPFRGLSAFAGSVGAGASLVLIATVRHTGTKTYFGAVVIAQACALVRYVVLARLLGPEQLGLVVIVVLAAHFFESITDTGADRFLIQDREGGSDHVIRLVQLMAVGRGCLMALLLLLLAGTIADFAEVPQIAGALRTLALVPLVGGFVQYQFRVAQRTHDFRSEAAITTVSELSGLAVTTAAALILRDYTAILYGLFARAATAVLVSHLTSGKPYRLGYSAKAAKRLWHFGAPLLVNGLLLFITTQSDRVIISRTLGVEELGRYSVVLLVVVYPNAVIMRYLGAMFLPGLSNTRDELRNFAAHADRLGGLALLLATGMCVGFAFAGPPTVPIVFGPSFGHQPALFALIGVLIGWRLMKVTPTTMALAAGSSGIVLTNNVLRLVAIPAALAGLILIGGLNGVVAGFIFGEIVANLSATLLVNRRMKWSAARDLDRYALFAVIGAAVVILATPYAAISPSLRAIAIGGIAVAVAVTLWRERATVKALGAPFSSTNPR